MRATKLTQAAYLRGTHLRVAEAMAGGPQTIAELAQRLNLPYEAIASTLRGMRNRGEVVALKAKIGQPNRYKLKAKAVDA